VNTAARPWVPPPESPRIAAVNAFGFGGINAHAILEEVADHCAWESLTPQSSELFLVSAESPAQLLDRLQLWSHRSATLRDEDLGDICFTEMGRVSDAHPVRLAIVVKSIADLRAKLEHAPAKIAAGKDASWQDPSGLYYGSSRYRGKLAFLFPGIGFPGLAGGYATRLAELYLHFPEIRTNLDVVDSLTKDETAGPPLSYQLFPPPLLDRDALAQIDRDLAWSERSPMGMSMANMASWDLLQLFALQPDAMAGFSLGELSALFASEVIDRDHFLDTLRQLRSAMRGFSQPGEETDALWAMVATSAERAEAIMQHIAGEVAVTMDISPSQVFIGGDKAAVRAALQKFQEAGIWGQALPVTPLLKPYITVHTEMAFPFEAQLRAIVEALPLGSGKCTVYSGTTAAPYPESPEAIREMFLTSVAQRVRIRDTIAQLYADGVRIFVQLGAGGKMLSNIENTLGGSDYVALSTDLPHRSGLEQLHHLLGRLATLGVPFRLSALYRYRRCRPIDFEKATGAASTGARRLSLTPPRLRLSAETSEWIRAQCGVQLQQPKPVAPKTPAVAPSGEPSIAEQSVAMMGRFLDVQRSWEETENELLRQFLETQVRATSVLSSAPAPQVTSSAETASVTRAARRTERPFVGEIQRLVPGLELEARLVLDLSQHLFLQQHALLNVPDDLKPAEERLATLPFTFELEILSEVAEALVPELRVIACHDLEAKRWISLESTRTLEVTIRARRVADSEVEVELHTEGHNAPAFRGRASLGVALPTPPAALEQVYDRDCPHTAAEFYRQGPLFHGRMFQLIRSFRGMSERDIGAELVASDLREYFATSPRANLVLDPLLLDALQQIVGYRAWLDGWFTMPIGMKRISLYGPPPAPGSPIRASVRYRRIDGRRIEADYEAYDAAGQMWIRVDSLQAWRVFCPKTLLEANHRPRDGFLARPWPVGQPEITCYRVSSEHLGDIKPEWIARLYLRPDEWARYKQKPALDWLLGRIAAKDAARDWLRQHKGMLLHPLEVEIVNQADGAPRLLVPTMPSLAISIAHTEDEAIAIVSQAPGVGVDLAAVKERGREFSDFAFRDDELSSLPQSPRDAWIHRGWCAKEAAVKAFRLGFAELPQLRIIAVEEKTGAVEMECKPRGIKIAAATWLDQNRTIAVVVPAS
jgi:acyl transferase domain-containing protein